MVTVLQVIPTLESGGAERTTVEIAQALTQAGWGALVASEGGAMEGELKAAGGRLIRLPVRSKNPLTVAQNARRLADLVGREGVGLIHARSRAPGWSALWAARNTQIPFITTYHGAYTGKSAIKRWYNGVMARGDIVIANSGYMKDRILERHHTDPARIRVVPRGVDTARFDPAAMTRERIQAVRRAWGLASSDARAVILLPARLTFWKGHETAMQALAMRSDLDAVLVFAGAGRAEDVAALGETADRLGVASRVIVAGPCDDMPAAYAASAVTITPSTRPEAFGRTAAEAQAMGAPVVATAHGGALEVVADGQTGLLVPPGDAAALAAAIAQTLAMPDAERAAMGRAGRQRVLDRFTATALQAATLDVYREALGLQ